MSYAGEILGALACTPDRDMESLTLEELNQHIVALHHRYLRLAVPVLEAHLAALPAECYRLFVAFRKELYRLLSRDEEIVFPRLSRLEDAGARADPRRLAEVLAWVGSAHADLRANLTVLRTRLGQSPRFPGARRLRRGLADLAEDLDALAILRDEVLFPRALTRARQVRAL
ncbi:hemerythrin domain-containing protein [bacterium]|nr:hemerythrin domain-containing protein [bacterium]